MQVTFTGRCPKDCALVLRRLRETLWIGRVASVHLAERTALSTLAAVTAGLSDRRLLGMTSVLARVSRLRSPPSSLRRDDGKRLMRRRNSLRLFRELRDRHAACSDTLQWYARVRQTAWNDPCEHLGNRKASTRMIALLQTGEYLLAVASVISRHPHPGRFHLCLPGLPTPGLQALMRALTQLGHWIELSDSNAPNAHLTMITRMRAGVTVIAFIDEATDNCHPDDVDAPLGPTLPPVHAAYVAGSSALLLAHRIDSGQAAGVHVLCHTPPVCPTAMCRRFAFHANRFISDDPANWAHL
jgi:hypothetical protein